MEYNSNWELCNLFGTKIVYITPLDLADRAKDSQKIKKKTNTSGVNDEGWNSQKQLSGPVEQEKKRRKKRKTPEFSSKTLSRFSSL